jgi:hypothetical protein
MVRCKVRERLGLMGHRLLKVHIGRSAYLDSSVQGNATLTGA